MIVTIHPAETFIRNRIVSAAAKWLATHQTPNGQNRPVYETALFECFKTVV